MIKNKGRAVDKSTRTSVEAAALDAVYGFRGNKTDDGPEVTHMDEMTGRTPKGLGTVVGAPIQHTANDVFPEEHKHAWTRLAMQMPGMRGAASSVIEWCSECGTCLEKHTFMPPRKNVVHYHVPKSAQVKPDEN